MIKFPDEILLRFDQLNSEFTDNAFGMGDLAVNVADEFGHVYPHADILRSLSSQTHIQYDTLRDRERVARAIPHDARMQYPMSFHQWRACMSKKADPLEVAEWAVSQDKPPTVEEIRAHVYGYGDDPAWMKVLESMKKLADRALDYDELPASFIDLMVKVSSIEIVLD